MLLKLFCDICKSYFNYPEGIESHKHVDLEIGGVPMNTWSTVYRLPEGKLNINHNKKGIFKYTEYLPDHSFSFSHGEGNTPLLCISNLNDYNEINVYLKLEGFNPTGSFKDRGMPLLIADAKSSDKNKVAIPSTGNAAISLIAYAKLACLDAIVFVPESTPESKLKLLRENSQIIIDKDLIQSYEHFFSYCKENKCVYNGFPVTNIPYHHGLKTTAYEIYLQLGKRAPDWLVIPCGSGGNFVAQYQGFKDLMNMKLINKLPKFVSIQIEGGDPITLGYKNKLFNDVVILDQPVSSTTVISSDTCFNYFKIIQILKETQGLPVSVTDEEIVKGYSNKKLPDMEFTSKSVFAALEKIKEYIFAEETVVLLSTARENIIRDE